MDTDAAYLRLAMRIFADFGVSIAAPAVIAALLGEWLDHRYGTDPWLLLSCLFVAFALTGIGIVRKVQRYSAEYKKLMDEESNAPRA